MRKIELLQLAQSRTNLISFLVLLISCLFCHTSIGQRLIKSPKRYEEPRDTINYEPFLEEKDFTNESWVVWVDRSGVVSENGTRLEFMQKCWVVGQTKDKLHLVEYDPSKYNYGLDEFRETPKDFGWVNKNNLLLWREALRSNDLGFRIKAMTITTPDLMLQQREDLLKEGAKKLAFYDDPISQQPNSNDSPLFEIFYILKKVEGRYLLSKTNDLTTGRASDYVYGWVEEDAIERWKQRQSLEPNWDNRAVAERSSTNTLPAAFLTDALAGAYAEGRITNSKALWTKAYTKREIPSWKRFPILKKEGNIVYTGIISSVFSGTGEVTSTMEPERFAVYQEMYNDKRKESRNINVVFVIDATRSMGPYIDATRDAVRRAIEKLSFSANSFSFGVVGYRDFEEEKDRRFEVWPINANKNTVYDNLTVLQAFHDRDRSQSEAVFSGLKEAVRLFQLKEGANKQTNAIIVIGDAGSDYDSTLESQNLEAVREVLISHNISLLSIQAHHNEHPAYDDFIFQIKDLIEETVTDIIGANNERLPNVMSFNADVSLRQREETLYRLNVDDATIAGGVQYARLGDRIDPEQVGQEIVSLIEDLDARNNALMNAMEKFLNSVQVDQGNEEVTPEMAEFLLEAGFDEDMILQLISKRYQFMFEAYVPLQLNALNNDLFKNVLFLDQQELDKLLEDLIKLVNIDGTGYAKRESLSEVWIKLLSTNYGVESQEILDMHFDDMLHLVTGLPSQSTLLGSYKLSDVLDKQKVNDQILNSILTDISTKVEDLRGISGDPEFFFRSNDARFYWIPQEYLP